MNRSDQSDAVQPPPAMVRGRDVTVGTLSTCARSQSAAVKLAALAILGCGCHFLEPRPLPPSRRGVLNYGGRCVDAHGFPACPSWDLRPGGRTELVVESGSNAEGRQTFTTRSSNPAVLGVTGGSGGVRCCTSADGVCRDASDDVSPDAARRCRLRGGHISVQHTVTVSAVAPGRAWVQSRAMNGKVIDEVELVVLPP
jgi:hypothetical protein